MNYSVFYLFSVPVGYLLYLLCWPSNRCRSLEHAKHLIYNLRIFKVCRAEMYIAYDKYAFQITYYIDQDVAVTGNRENSTC